MKELSDNEIVEKYLKGDQEALEVLIKRYLKPIYSFVYKNVGDSAATEDITQEVFVKMWKNLKKFKRGSSFKSWIFTIAKNTAIDFLRKKRTVPFSNFANENGGNSIMDALADREPSPLEVLEQKNTAAIIAKAVNKLLPKYRAVISLRHNSQLTFSEIANRLGEPLNTIKSRYRRGLLTLKKLIINY